MAVGRERRVASQSGREFLMAIDFAGKFYQRES